MQVMRWMVVGILALALLWIGAFAVRGAEAAHSCEKPLAQGVWQPRG